jgi:hypothetical protein
MEVPLALRNCTQSKDMWASLSAVYTPRTHAFNAPLYWALHWLFTSLAHMSNKHNKHIAWSYFCRVRQRWLDDDLDWKGFLTSSEFLDGTASTPANDELYDAAVRDGNGTAYNFTAPCRDGYCNIDCEAWDSDACDCNADSDCNSSGDTSRASEPTCTCFGGLVGICTCSADADPDDDDSD